MTGVYCFSGSGHSRAVADYFASELNTQVTEITRNTVSRVQLAVVVFPVYCQNIPEPMRAFLKELQAEYAVLVATYGKISFGNVIHEAAEITRAKIIAAACVPTGHSFLGEGAHFDAEALKPIFERMADPREAVIGNRRKNIFADLLPSWRSRMGIKIIRRDACTSCGACTAVCPLKAINNGVISGGCIRCLKCVTSCPQKALQTKLSAVMKLYFRRRRKDELVLYL